MARALNPITGETGKSISLFGLHLFLFFNMYNKVISIAKWIFLWVQIFFFKYIKKWLAVGSLSVQLAKV